MPPRWRRHSLSPISVSAAHRHAFPRRGFAAGHAHARPVPVASPSCGLYRRMLFHSAQLLSSADQSCIAHSTQLRLLGDILARTNDRGDDRVLLIIDIFIDVGEEGLTAVTWISCSCRCDWKACLS